MRDHHLIASAFHARSRRDYVAKSRPLKPEIGPDEMRENVDVGNSLLGGASSRKNIITCSKHTNLKLKISKSLVLENA